MIEMKLSRWGFEPFNPVLSHDHADGDCKESCLYFNKIAYEQKIFSKLIRPIRSSKIIISKGEEKRQIIG
jgi:hypothetical protein